ncbi:MAG: aminotransferase class V-fold PLP-dependent enzyme [Gemmatimonadota bacterium]|jgi:glutamate/tyrosine decarboxylase-like PLP-dependent enzyme
MKKKTAQSWHERRDCLPETGWEAGEIRRVLGAAKGDDADWQNGRIWSLVYYGGESHADFLIEAFDLYAAENALSPTAFPSVRRFERDIVSMLRTLLRGGANVVGTMTSGGTESILLAVKTYRDRARRRNPSNRRLDMILPASAHPAFLKAAQYFDVTPVVVPVRDDLGADPDSMAQHITERTIMLAASAPCFPYGVVDPVAELGTVAAKHNIGLHVDACLGGLMLPFLRRLGKPVPDFDFVVPGVTSISVDLHKYGYALKGASANLYRSVELRRHQFFVETEWAAGLFGSAGMLGTRSGGIIAAAWAGMMRLGEAGYLDLARRTSDLTERLQAGIASIPGLRIVGRPDMTVFAFTADGPDIFAIADRMADKGWHLDRQVRPDSIHLVVTPQHEAVVDEFLRDLAAATRDVAARGEQSLAGSSTLYGVTAAVSDTADPRSAVIAAMEKTLDE